MIAEHYNKQIAQPLPRNDFMDPIIRSKAQAIISWEKYFTNKRDRRFAPHIAELRDKAEDPADEYAEYWGLQYMESQNLKKYLYDEKPPEVTDDDAREDFCDKWYDKIKAEYDRSEDAKAKAAETVALRKVTKEVEDSGKQNKVYEQSKASPLTKDVEELKRRALKRVSDNRARKQLKFPHGTKRRRTTPPGTPTGTASNSPRRGRSPTPPPGPPGGGGVTT